MRLIKCTSIQDFRGSKRKYYELDSARLIDVKHSSSEELWHKHEITTEVLFVIDGRISVKGLDKQDAIEVGPNEIILIPPNEWHLTEPLTASTRIIVFKYVNKSDTILNDWIKMDWIDMRTLY